MGEKKDNLLSVQQSPPVVDTRPLIDIPVKVPGIAIKEREPMTWNTKHLSQRVAVDVASAASAGGLVAPVIYMIDK